MNEIPATAKTRILIVEDDRDLNTLLKYTLEMTGLYEVISFFGATGVVSSMSVNVPDLAILDIMLPSQSGIELLREMRSDSRFKCMPAILLTARSQEQDKIDGFEAGADDYITKPFSPRELILRVQALLRRTGGAERARPATEVDILAEIVIGPLRILPTEAQVFLAGELLTLTVTEFQLLVYLAERSGRLQSREILLQKVWGYEGNLNTRTVDTHVKRLRQKLGEWGNLIETVHGFGYQLVPEPRSRL